MNSYKSYFDRLVNLLLACGKLGHARIRAVRHIVVDGVLVRRIRARVLVLVTHASADHLHYCCWHNVSILFVFTKFWGAESI